MSLSVRPCTFRQACAYVAEHHRHNKPPRGHKFSIAAVANDEIVGVAMVGRPVARLLDDGLTAEVNRTCTGGYRNANSLLYGAAWRAAKAMGYQHCITYTQHDESGASLKAAGWVRIRDIPARKSWRESSKKLKHLRDEVGTGGVARTLWAIGTSINQVKDMKNTPVSQLQERYDFLFDAYIQGMCDASELEAAGRELDEARGEELMAPQKVRNAA